MSEAFDRHLQSELDAIRDAGFHKEERPLVSSQGRVVTADGRELLNLCANNYLGLADDPRLVEAAKAALDRNGFGMASIRFICGTQSDHRTLEQSIAEFLGMDDAHALLVLLRREWRPVRDAARADDVVISDALNHASIIDGIRLCRRERQGYANNDMAELERAAEGGGGRAVSAGRDRRRVLDGRGDRRSRSDLRPGGKLRCAGDG